MIRAARRRCRGGLARAARDLGAQYAQRELDRFHVPDARTQVDWFREVLARPLPPGTIWLVAELGGEAVGDARARLSEPAATAPIQPQLDVGRKRVDLNWLAVQERHRSHGVGGRLLDGVEAWSRESGAELIVTDTNLRSNIGAVELYERHGYERQAVAARRAFMRRRRAGADAAAARGARPPARASAAIRAGAAGTSCARRGASSSRAEHRPHDRGIDEDRDGEPEPHLLHLMRLSVGEEAEHRDHDRPPRS